MVKMGAFTKFLIGGWIVCALAFWAAVAYIVYAVLTHYHIV